MRIYAPSRMQSVKDLPGQTKLKFRCAAVLFTAVATAVLGRGVRRQTDQATCSATCRQPGQNTVEDLEQGDLRSKLEEKERKHYLKTKSTNFEGAFCGAFSNHPALPPKEPVACLLPAPFPPQPALCQTLSPCRGTRG